MPLDSLDFETMEQIGRGGFGRVYRVRHKHVERMFALKLLDPWGGDDGGANRDRFLREARILFDLFHPNIVRVFDVGLRNDQPFILMELVQGRTLQDELAAVGRLRPETALGIVTEIVEGLCHAHEKVIHRDLKPGNVMIDRENRVRLLDFGLGVYIEEDLVSRITRTGEQVVGGHYTAPELLANPRLRDPRVDIYSVGAIWYELLMGRVPAGVGIERALADEVQMSAERAAVLLRCLKPAAERYSSASELLQDLKGTERGGLASRGAESVERGDAASTSNPTDGIPASVEVADPALTAAHGFTCQLVSRGTRFWTYGWRLVLQNLSRGDSRYWIECRYLNEHGHVLRALTDNSGIVLRPNESKAFPGNSYVDAELAMAVGSVLAIVSRREAEVGLLGPTDAGGERSSSSAQPQLRLALDAWRLLQVVVGYAAELVSPMQRRPDFWSRLRDTTEAERFLRTHGLEDAEIASVLASDDPPYRSQTFARIEDSRRYRQVENALIEFQNFVIENEPRFSDPVYAAFVTVARGVRGAMAGFSLALQEPQAFSLEQERVKANEGMIGIQDVGMKDLKKILRTIPGMADGLGE